jgi:hypothetical protein
MEILAILDGSPLFLNDIGAGSGTGKKIGEISSFGEGGLEGVKEIGENVWSRDVY